MSLPVHIGFIDRYTHVFNIMDCDLHLCGYVVTDPVSEIPQFILISTEVQGYRHENHTPTDEAYAAIGDTFLVDYVRVFDIVEQ